ncbi:PfkB family carbohydrate kinase [Pediococcus siamensis]|uniref:PfkB family carbohydrate kinase n=1 Tax=Pediococcus siamensis TaxID=381829 RepID=UPI0039A2CA68
MKLISIGDNVTDTYVDDGVYYPGGNCVNVAVAARMAGAEKSDYMGIFGNDQRAENIKSALIKENVALINCRKVYAPSAAPQVLIDMGDRVFAPGPKNSAQHLFKLRLTVADFQEISTYNVLHTSVYSNLENDLSKIQEYTKVSFDFSEQQNRSYLQKVLPNTNFAFFSGAHKDKKEVELLGKYCLQFPNVEVVSVTRGAQPAILITRRKIVEQPTIATHIVDTMGAGDSFIGGFLNEYINTGNLQSAGEKAALNAAKTCEISGGFGHPFLIEKRERYEKI